MSDLTLPLRSGTVTVTAVQLAAWSRAFPRHDVPGELRRMRLWLEANPSRRKTARGLARFVYAWLARAEPVSRLNAAAHRPFKREPERPRDPAVAGQHLRQLRRLTGRA